MARGSSSSLGQIIAERGLLAARKSGALLSAAGNNLSSTADKKLNSSKLENAKSLTDLPSAFGPSTSSEVAEKNEMDYIYVRSQLADDPKVSSYLIGASSNTLLLEAVERCREAELRKPLPRLIAEDIMAAGVWSSGDAPSRSVTSLMREPHDSSDLYRCEVTYALAPPHLQPYMFPTLNSWRGMIKGSEAASMREAPPAEVLEAFYSSFK